MGPSVDQRFCKKKKRVKFWGKLRVFWGFSFFSLAFFAFFFSEYFAHFGVLWGGFGVDLGGIWATRVRSGLQGHPLTRGSVKN